MLKTRNLIIVGLLVGGAFALPHLIDSDDSLVDVDVVDTTLSTEETRQTFYKWQDANGVWQFGDNPPQGVQTFPVNIDTAANVLKPVDKPSVKQASSGKTQISSDAPKPGSNAVLNPELAQQAIDDAKAIQGILEQRSEMMNNLTK